MEKFRDLSRMAEWALFSLVLLAIIGWVAPEKLGLVIYKLSLITLFAYVGYWLWRRMFRYGGREENNPPESYTQMMLARSIFVGAIILSGAIAL